MLAHNAAFSLKIEQITDIAAQKGNIPSSADALNDLRHMMTTIMARSFTEKLMFSGTEGLNSIYANWEQEVLSFINWLWDTATLTNQLDMNADWTTDVHGNKYKFWLYHPAWIGNYTVPATLFMMYSPDGSNTQVLWPVQVASGAEADAMKARWQQELLKMKRIHASYKGGTYDIFRGTNEKGEDVYWAKYVFGGRLYETGFQSWDTSTIIKYVETLLDQKVLASQRTSSYENQYDEIWAGYESTTALYASIIPNFPYVQKAPKIILQTQLEVLLYNRIVVLESQFSPWSSLDSRSDNLTERSQLYATLGKYRYEKIRTLPDGAEKDAEIAQARLIAHELTKIAILQCQISAEMELGTERINAIKAGMEFGVSFVPIASSVVSFVLLFDESKSLDEKAWELAGLLPYGKVGKYAGKVDDVIYLSGNVMKKERLVNTSLDSIYVFGDMAINATKARLKSLAKRWTPAQIDAIKNADPARAWDVQKLFDQWDILDIIEDVSGKPVFLTADRFDHLAKEIRRLDSESRLQQFIDKKLIQNSDDLVPFIHKVMKEATWKSDKNWYEATIDWIKIMIPALKNGFITTFQK